jgi:hypothetical protein
MGVQCEPIVVYQLYYLFVLYLVSVSHYQKQSLHKANESAF